MSNFKLGGYELLCTAQSRLDTLIKEIEYMTVYPGLLISSNVDEEC